MKEKLKIFGKMLAIVAGSVLLLVALTIAGPEIRRILIHEKPDTTQQQIDSLKTDRELAKLRFSMLEDQYKAAMSIILQQDSLIKANQKAVTNEIKKLRAADNSIILSVRDSIIHARNR